MKINLHAWFCTYDTNVFKQLNNNMINRIFLLGFVLISQLALAQKTIEIDLKKHFDKYGVNGCFMMYNQSWNFNIFCNI